MKYLMKKTNSFLIFIASMIFTLSYTSTAPELPIHAIIEETIALFKKRGGTAYMINEKITQLQHALQAAYIAYFIGAPRNVIVGALYHDIGDLVDLSHVGDTNRLQTTHADLGAQWLKEHVFPEEIVFYAQYHTFAKVWLCLESSDYYNTLSRASKESYHAQQKQFDEETKRIITQHSAFSNLITVRMCDDMAKIPNITPLSIEDWATAIQDSLENKEDSPRDYNWQFNAKKLHALSVENPNEFISTVFHLHT